MYFIEAIERIKQMPIEENVGNVLVKESWGMKKAIQYIPRPGNTGLFFTFKMSYFDIDNYFTKDRRTLRLFKPNSVSCEDLIADDWVLYYGKDLFGHYKKENCIRV